MNPVFRRIVRVLVIFLFAAAAWAVMDLARYSQVHHVIAPGTPAETLVVQPGRSVMALYGFLVLVTLLPPLAVAALVWLPGGENGIQPLRPGARVFYATLVVVGLAVSGAIAGFAYESLRS